MTVNATSGERVGSLQLRGLRKEYPGGHVGVSEIDLDIEAGEFLTILGPSGCGKTTTLRMIAGFESVTAGSIKLDGLPVEHTPPHKRPMAMVFQSYALFPHMTVLDNIRFGLKIQKVPRAEATRRISAAVETMGLSSLTGRFPHQLSGGQQQRVALARAIVIEPKVLLFDEPLSNLDAKLRASMRHEIRALQQRLGITSIFVTHDQDEAMTMSDRIVVMNSGRIEQVGTPEDLYRRPESRFVADFLGQANFLPVEVMSSHGGSADIRLGEHQYSVANPSGVQPGPSTVLLRPEAVRLIPHGADADARIRDVVYFGASAEYTIAFNNGTTFRASVANPHPVYEQDAEVSVALSADDLWLIPQ